MVRIVVYVEGGNTDGSAAAIDSSNLYREGFNRLLSQAMPDNAGLAVQVIGTIHLARKYLERMNASETHSALLIDLDGPPSARQQRINDNYPGLDTSCLFFMVQEMESWILSQPEVLDTYGTQQGLKRAHVEEKISENSVLEGQPVQEIPDPAGKLNTLFRRYLKIEKVKDNKIRHKPKDYHKVKDGPALIGLLNFNRLILDFEDAERLAAFLSKAARPLDP